MTETDAQTHTRAAPRLGHRPELDGVRGLAILLVFGLHLRLPWMPGGAFGVDLFFVLSGFLITVLLVEEWAQTGAISLRAFWARRALRLLPALLWVCMVVGAYAAIRLPSAQAWENYRGTVLALSYVSNLVYVYRPLYLQHALGITWSLAIEEQFYLLWPPLLVLALKLGVRRRLLLAVAVATAGVAVYRIALWRAGASVLRLYYASDTRADALLAGCLAGLMFTWDCWPRGRAFGRMMQMLAALYVVLLGYLVVTTRGFGRLFKAALVAWGAALALTVLVRWPVRPALALLRWPVLVWLGRVSYGLYLWHWAVVWFLFPRAYVMPPARRILMAAALSLVLTTFSYYCIERPFLRWKKRFTPARRADS